MDAQEQNLFLLNIPVLVIDKILSNLHNPSNVSRTCRYLYEIVCHMEKRRRVMYIGPSHTEPPSFNIDADAVFDSIMNSHRTIKAIELRVNNWFGCFYELNERHLQRITVIMKQFGATVTSLKLDRFVVPLNFIVELLQQAPKLESLSLNYGEVTGNSTMPLQLPSLKTLEIIKFTGLLDIVKLIPAGSLNSIRYDRTIESTEVIATILAKQHNIKTLTIEFHYNFDFTTLRVDHLQLETLIFKSCRNNDSQFVEILKFQTNLKELRFVSCALSGISFQWICSNLKKLEVFQVDVLDSIEGNAFEMLGELKQLRHFRTSSENYISSEFGNGFQLSQFKSNSIEKFEIGMLPDCSPGDRLNKVLHSMAHNLPNLTHLRMRFENFSTLCYVLGRCTKIIHLTGRINNPIPHKVTEQQRFPNIQHLKLSGNYYLSTNEDMCRSMTSIVRTMPNLKSMMMKIGKGLKFDVQSMNEFIRESKSLEYFYVNQFELHRELSADDVIESIRCLTDQLKGFHIEFRPSKSAEDTNWHQIKDILSNALYVGDYFEAREYFYLHRGAKKFRYF